MRKSFGEFFTIKGSRQTRADLKAAGEAPMLVGYLTMAMKINPNLENACSFAGEQLGGEMGQELRRKTSEGHMRLHSGADGTISEFAKRWESACPEINRAVYLIRSSVNELTASCRARTLDRALQIVLQGAGERARAFASSISLPTLMIYSLGVLLPLVFVVILPVLSVIDVQIGLMHIVFLYCFALPLAVYFLSRSVLSKRPAAIGPPQVPLSGNPVRAAAMASAAAVPIPFLSISFNAPPDVCALSVLWGFVLGVSVFGYLRYVRPFRRRGEILQMEAEFCDALVQLGNRICEGRPAEDAFLHVAESMVGSELEGVLRAISANVRLGGMGLRAAIFDDAKGALSLVGSSLIRSILKMLVDLIEHNTRAAGEAILQTAEHLRELKSVEAETKRAMAEVVTSMRSVAIFFAPLVTSVAARLQGLLSSETAVAGFLGTTSVSPPSFLFVLGVYIVILTSILVGYAIEIELGDDRLAKRAAIVSALPVALGVFTAGAILGGQMIGALIG